MRRFSFYTLATLLVAGVAITACTSDDLTEGLKVNSGKTYTLSVNATKGADTRTLIDEGTTLSATWNLDDEVDVYLDGEKVGTLKPDKAEANALLTGTVTGVKVGDDLDLKFGTPDNYASQIGSLEGIDANCNYAIAEVTVSEIVGDAVKTSDAVFENQQCITKFTFNEEVSKVVIDYGADAITVTPAAATSTLYVAIPATIGEADFTFTATVDGKTYKGEKSATLENGMFYTASIELSADLDDYIDLSADATANTYMVTAAGKYKFKATVKGNGGIDPLTGTTATAIDKASIAGVKVLWELYSQGRAIKHDGTAYDISYSDGYVYFSTPDEFTSGDAYVAVYDSKGTILWSWLIWATSEVDTMTHNEKTFMDRNLGAIDVGYCMRGFLYEWGRKDPFSAANGGYDVYPYVPVATSIFTHITGSYSMDYTIKNPTQWIRGYDYSYSWMNETEYSLKPWQPNVKTIYDPCPSGWRIPVKEEISNISGLPNTGIGGGYDPDEYYKGFGNPGTGYYWTTSTDEGSDQRAYAFCNDGRNINHWGQDQGYAIRPVKE